MTTSTFFLVGAPRCGTTALFTYLSEHPRIHTTTPKEPLFWCDDFGPYRVVTERSEYERLMRPSAGTLASGEGSTLYLLSKSALPALQEYRPDARILVVLRNPVEQFLSWHGWMLQSLEEDQPDPEQGWNLQAERAAGQKLPTTSRAPLFVQYRQVAAFAEQITRLFRHFPREQVRVVIFEEMIAAPRETYEGVLQFLNVPSDGRREFPRINERRQWRSGFANRLYRCPPRAIKPLVEAARQTWLRMPERVQKPFRSLFFARGAAKPVLRPEFRESLREQFANEVGALEELLQRDLSCWGFRGKLAA